MIRALANWAAKQYYIFNQEFQAKTADLHAGLSLRLAGEKRALIAQLNKEADDIEANIKSVDEKLVAGFWECENGHEFTKACSCASEHVEPIVHSQQCWLSDKGGQVLCRDCEKPAKFISAATMTGQEKYESDKERKEAEQIAESKRAQAKAEEENVTGSEKAAKYFQDEAKNKRTIAEKIRSL